MNYFLQDRRNRFFVPFASNCTQSLVEELHWGNSCRFLHCGEEEGSGSQKEDQCVVMMVECCQSMKLGLHSVAEHIVNTSAPVPGILSSDQRKPILYSSFRLIVFLGFLPLFPIL